MSKTDKPIRAVALRYDHEAGATPKVTATGQGEVARRIIEAAQAAGVDIVEDADLLEILGRVPIGEDIPPELFQAVAEILAFIYRINGRYSVSTS
ncbi:MAG: flagellar biosynthesis protein FlhB [Deltaproteobacteria bacterium]|nr:flagellar biosynthesis protein FlhB [Deltaproteobacteria bacterium]